MTSPDQSNDTFSVLKDFYTSVVFLTRLPAPAWPEAASRSLSAAMWTFPLAGVLVAAIGGIVFAVCDLLALPPMVSGILTVAALIIATGGLHEDGLSDLADGVWGASAPDKRLAIMSDSRIGAFGALALIVSVGGRAAAIAAIAEPLYVFGALVAAAAASRSMMPVVMAWIAPAKTDGLGASAGRPDTGVWSTGLIIAALVVILTAPAGWLWCLAGAAAGAALIAWWAQRMLSGYTGDVLGAVQQAAELFALALIASQIAQAG